MNEETPGLPDNMYDVIAERFTQLEGKPKNEMTEEGFLDTFYYEFGEEILTLAPAVKYLLDCKVEYIPLTGRTLSMETKVETLPMMVEYCRGIKKKQEKKEKKQK